MQNKLDLAAIRQLHKEGEWEQAKAGYLAILQQNPGKIEALHWLGILYVQQENYAAAIDSFQQAIYLDGDNPSLQLHFANALKLQGLFSQAIPVLQKTIARYPQYIAAFNNLGTVYYAQGKLDDAIIYYRKAITKQANYVDAYYNLGLALAKKNLFTEAITTYQQLLHYAPKHFAARFHLACILMQQHNIPAALSEFQTIAAAQPYHFETQTNLATCYLKQGGFNEAKLHYQNALKLHPDDTQILFNLGYINMQQSYLDTAIQYYQRAIRINPDLLAAHNNLGVAFLAKQHPNFALQHFQAALRLQPDNAAIAYTVKMLAQNQHLLTAPPDYIQSLFDAYADHYEAHLLNALDYKMPEIIQQALSGLISPAKSLDILDLGCGTGLCGSPFKAYAKTLTGVDLSAKMLEVAAQKNLYHSLVISDMTTFLADKIAQYDLILAGDVLVYVGELATIFQLTHTALQPGGLFVFNTEIADSIHYQINQSGRFSHNQSYLNELATKYHFKVISYQKIITRMQNNAPVSGHLYVLQSL
jgi:predicted TPR repeat methyltransferase